MSEQRQHVVVTTVTRNKVAGPAQRMPQIRDWNAITFLEEHPYLRDLLTLGTANLLSRFGAHAEGVALDLYHDPDGGADTQLFVVIRTGLSVGEAHSHLDAFDAEWWFDHQSQARGNLGFTLEFA